MSNNEVGTIVIVIVLWTLSFLGLGILLGQCSAEREYAAQAVQEEANDF